MSEENENPENAGIEVLPSSENPNQTIADRLDEIPVERLSPEELADLEKLKQELVYVGIDDIRPSPNKERKNDPAVPKVAESIRQCGFRSPIYVNGETNEIVIGHTRWAAAKKLGFHTVPVVFIFDLSPSKLKLLKLADNKVAEFSGWDFTELNKTLDELKLELPDLDFGDLGFVDEIVGGANTGSEIDRLSDNGFGVEEYKGVSDKIQMTFVFDKSDKPLLDGYISKHGKDGIVRIIIEGIGNGN